MPKYDAAGQSIWYDVFGTGPHSVLLIPGAIGTAKSDFSIQLDSSSPFCFDFSKFTFVCVELPGWGRSTPPGRQFSAETYRHDAKCCMMLMKHLKHHRYSIVSWSDGSKVGLVLSHLYGGDGCIRALVVQGAITFESEQGRKNILWSHNVRKWNQDQLANYVVAYGDDVDRVALLWDRHIGFIEHFGEYFPCGLLGSLEDGLAKLEPPTLVLHGDKDFFVELDQAELLYQYIPNVRLVRFSKGAHNLHQTEPLRYKELVEAFLNEN